MIPKEYAVMADVPTALNPAVMTEVIPLPARIALLRHAVTLGPDPSVLCELSVALAEAGEMAEAARVFRRAYLLQPDIACKALTAIEAANIAKCCDFARFLIAQGSAFAPVIATLAITEGRLGNTAVAQKLIDYDSLFRSYVMEPPPGYDVASICRALAQEIKSDLKFYNRPSDRAIRQAWRHDMGVSRLPASKAWVRAVRREIDRYIANLPQLRDHPFLASRPQDYVLAAWAVVSDGASHHLPHIHPRAWMSGVYYVVQPAASRDTHKQCGWLHVGPPEERTDVTSARGWEERNIEPEPGRLVLMPGYFFHRTEPMGVDEERICIAFDVMPVELAGEDPEAI
jgi:hypothetical protein